MMSELINIDLYVNDRPFGMRKWPAVPRIGESVFVEVRGDLHVFPVIEVRWGTTEISRKNNGCCDVTVFLAGELP